MARKRPRGLNKQGRHKKWKSRETRRWNRMMRKINRLMPEGETDG